MNIRIRHLLVVGTGAALAVALSACSSYGSTREASLRAGQESTFHTPQGETGTPHGHAGSMANPAARGMGYGGRTPANVTPAAPMGQESSKHTPQGETVSPHTH